MKLTSEQRIYLDSLDSAKKRKKQKKQFKLENYLLETNEFYFICDKNGDFFKVNKPFNIDDFCNPNQNSTLTPEMLRDLTSPKEKQDGAFAVGNKPYCQEDIENILKSENINPETKTYTIDDMRSCFYQSRIKQETQKENSLDYEATFLYETFNDFLKHEFI